MSREPRAESREGARSDRLQAVPNPARRGGLRALPDPLKRVTTNRGRVLGLDYGTKRVGVALSDPERKIASPLETYTRRTPPHDADHLRRLVAEHDVGEVVVGLPVHAGGTEGRKAREARKFGQWVAEVTGLPVVFWDERFSSVEAEQALQQAALTSKKRKARRDMLAAQIMLQSYLDAPEKARKIAPLEDE